MKSNRMVRLSKSIIALWVGLFCLLVSADNVIDFDTNYYFLQHVLSMNSMQPFFHGKHLYWRAITLPAIHLSAYWFIILTEFMAGILCLLGGVKMLVNINSNEFFSKAKSLYIMGATIAIFIWYFCFCVIGGEWFSMWANKWNAQTKAYTISSFVLITLIYILMPESNDNQSP